MCLKQTAKGLHLCPGNILTGSDAFYVFGMQAEELYTCVHISWISPYPFFENNAYSMLPGVPRQKLGYCGM